MSMKKSFAVAIIGSVLALGACSNPYNPGQRAVGGGVLGGLGGAALGGVLGGGSGALIGGLGGAAVGAGVGAATTPQRPSYGY